MRCINVAIVVLSAGIANVYPPGARQTAAKSAVITTEDAVIASRTDATADWVDFQNRNARVAFITPGMVVKHDFVWSRRDACTIRVDDVTDSGRSISRSRYDIQLRVLDPVGTIFPTPSPDQSTTLAFEVTTGENAVHVELTNSKASVPIWVIPEASTPAADSAKRLGELAIRACGGRESTPAERAAHDARRNADKNMAAALLGTTLDPEFKKLLIGRCQDDVKAKLKAPNTALFDSTTSVMKVPTGDNYMVLGSVEAQNSFGGRISNSYLCQMAKYGEQWVVTSTTIR